MATTALQADSRRQRVIGPTVRLHLILIVLCAVAVRAIFYLAYKPIWAGDSTSYSLAWYFWAHHQFYLGERTPVYPLLLGLAQWVHRQPANVLPSFAAAYTVLVWQSLLDILACVGFYFTLCWLTGKEKIAFVAALILAGLAAPAWYEMQILNMTVAFFLVTAIATMYVALLRRIDAGRPMAALAFATGIVMSLAVLDRPELLLFSVVLVVGTGFLRWTPFGSADGRGLRLLNSALLMMVGIAPLLLLWMSFMYAGIGEFRITTLDGWNKSRTVYNLFDRVPPEDHALGAVLSRSYAAQLQHKGQVNMREHMFIAFDDLKAHYGEFPIDHSIALHPSARNLEVAQFAFRHFGLQRIPCSVSDQLNCYESMRARIDLGDYIGDVSTKLVRRYPFAWARNVLVDWFAESFNFSYVDFKEAVFGFKDITVDGGNYIRSQPLNAVALWLVRLQSPLVMLAYLANLVFALAGPVLLFRRARPVSLTDSAVVLLALASSASVFLMCAIAGFNRIYHLPFLAIFLLSGTYTWTWFRPSLPTSGGKAED